MAVARNDLFFAIESHLTAAGYVEVEPEPIRVDWLSGEFNRCALHSRLNDLCSLSNVKAHSINEWAVSPVCRVNDMRRTGAGTHQSVFDMVAFYGTSRERRGLLERISGDFLHLASSVFSIPKEDLYITYFAGGEVIPNLELEEDLEWKDVWTGLGIGNSKLIPVVGPKNFLLFVGDGERVGAKCEVFARLGGGGEKIEIGSLICDDKIIKVNDQGVSIICSLVKVSGGALGVERCLAKKSQTTDLMSIKPLSDIVETIRMASRQTALGLQELSDDVYKMADLIHALVHLLPGNEFDADVQRQRVLESVSRRVHRKVMTLQIDEVENVILQSVACVERCAAESAVGRIASGDAVLDFYKRNAHVASWNPDCYNG